MGHRSAHAGVPALIVIAAAGSAVMAATSWRVAALPSGWQGGEPAARVLFYLGLAAVTAGWLALGRLVIAGHVAPRATLAFLAASAVPLLGAAPFGRDLWAYAAQGNLVAHGVDPYTHGPSAIPGVFTDQMSPRWLDSPSPYGPLWLQLSRLAAGVSAAHPTAAALVLRVPAVLALALIAWGLLRLARRFDRPASQALWLGAANPLIVVLGIGGGHNDLPMLGAIVAAAALACGRGWMPLALAASVAALGVMVKSPAVIAVAFVVPVWLHANRRPLGARRVITACAVALGAAATTVAVLTAACGLGTGWTSQVNADAQWVSWLSLPSAVIMLARAFTGTPLKIVDDALRTARTTGEALTAVGVTLLWFVALRRAPLTCFAAALGLAALLAPAVQPWYYTWGIALAALVVRRRLSLVLLATVTVAFPIMITPSGFGLESGWWALPITGAALALAHLALASAKREDGAHHTGAEVRSDHRAELGDVQLPEVRQPGS